MDIPFQHAGNVLSAWLRAVWISGQCPPGIPFLDDARSDHDSDRPCPVRFAVGLNWRSRLEPRREKVSYAGRQQEAKDMSGSG